MRDGGPGRPLDDRHALARAFIAKSGLNLVTTAALIERLHVDTTLRRLVGWERAADVPSEATFSRAFAEFADEHIPERVHEALIETTLKDHLVGHIARDATAIEAREQPDRRKKPQAEAPKRKRGRPRKGELVPQKEPRRLERQTGQTLSEMLADLPDGMRCRHQAQCQGPPRPSASTPTSRTTAAALRCACAVRQRCSAI